MDPPRSTAPDDLWLQRLDQEHANILAVLVRARHGQDIETGLRLASNLWRFWHMRGEGQEGLSWIEDLLDRAEEDAVAPAVRGHAHYGAGSLACSIGSFDLAVKHYEEAEAILSGRRSRALSDGNPPG